MRTVASYLASGSDDMSKNSSEAIEALLGKVVSNSCVRALLSPWMHNMSPTVSQIITDMDKKQWLCDWPMQHTIFFQKNEHKSKGTIVDVVRHGDLV
ncbi:hypothetical protein TURU_167187 [Turdus rufiventris]|nr:hypothetical protein TURU_167187 [Turdus rufiventris]